MSSDSTASNENIKDNETYARVINYLKGLTPADVLVAIHSVIMGLIIAARFSHIGPVAVKYLLLYCSTLTLALFIAPSLDRISHPLINNAAVRSLRNLYPMMLLGPFFRWTQPVSHMFFSKPFDPILIEIDKAIFGFHISKDLVNVWGNNYWLTEWMSFAYMSFYWVCLYLPIYLYFKGKMKEYYYVLCISGAVIFFCFVLQSMFPAEGPIYNDPSINGHLAAGPISHLADIFLSKADVPGSAMPSGHIAATVAVFILAWRYARTAFWLTMPVVVSLCISTVYCRIHYAIDGIVAIALTIPLVYIIGPRSYRYFFPDLLPDDVKEKK